LSGATVGTAIPGWTWKTFTFDSVKTGVRPLAVTLYKDSSTVWKIVDSETGTIAGLAIVEDNNLSDNTLVVGDGRFGKIYEKAGIVLSEGYGDGQFVRDQKTIKARVRMLMLIRNVDKTGFLKCTNITTALATLTT
jgi:hypothetical protein